MLLLLIVFDFVTFVSTTINDTIFTGDKLQLLRFRYSDTADFVTVVGAATYRIKHSHVSDDEDAVVAYGWG